MRSIDVKLFAHRLNEYCGNAVASIHQLSSVDLLFSSRKRSISLIYHLNERNHTETETQLVNKHHAPMTFATATFSPYTLPSIENILHTSKSTDVRAKRAMCALHILTHMRFSYEICTTICLLTVTKSNTLESLQNHNDICGI